MDEQAEYISIAEASKLLGVHRNTIRNRIKGGRYKAHKVVTPQGETYAIERESLGPSPTNTSHNSDAPGITTTVRHNGHNPAQAAPLVSPEHQTQADAIVQRLLAPFIAELGAVREELGRVKAERDAHEAMLAELRRRAEAAEAERTAAEGERDALRLQLAEASVPPVVVVAPQEAPEPSPTTVPTPTTPPGLWRRLRRALGRT